MKTALVLAGGGTKGSYEIGAYQALTDLGYKFDIITGTSIGALNAAMIVQGEHDKAAHLWNSLTADKVFVNNGLDVREDISYYIENRNALLPLVKKYISAKGVDITPFKHLMDIFIDEEKFFNSKTDFGLMTVKFPSLIPVEITKQNIEPGYLKKWLLASASCFPAFPVCEIDDEKYIDGMYYDNIPIDTALRLGASEIIAVSLRPYVNEEKYFNHPLVKFIEPADTLGRSMIFENETITQNMKRGYWDAMKTVGSYFGNIYTFYCYDQKFINEVAKEFLAQIMRAEIDKNPTEQRIGLIKLDVDKVSKYIEKHVVKSRDQLLSTLAAAIEIYMSMTEKDIYLQYDVKEIFKEMKKQASENTENFALAKAKEIAQTISNNNIDEIHNALRSEDIDLVTLAVLLTVIERF